MIICHVITILLSIFLPNIISQEQSILSTTTSSNFSTNSNILALLQTIQLKFQSEISSKKFDVCSFVTVRSSIDLFLNDEIWNRIVKVSSSSIRLEHRKYPVLIHTTCFNTDSFGNSLSEYIETRICAHKNGLHYVDIAKEPEHDFFKEFPSIVPNTNPLDPMIISQKINKICECPSICHEWDYGLMHKNMNIAKDIVRNAMKQYYDKILPKKKYLTFSSKSTYTSTNSSIDFNKLPFLSDAAIHYRCGDNLVTHYGFLPFHVFKKYIPTSTTYIYIMAEFPGRNEKLHSQDRCNAIFDAMKEYFKKHFSQSVVIIMRGNDIFDDLLRLSFAKILICSTSTFCFWPAIANDNTAYFPLTKLIAKENTRFNYGNSFNWITDPHDHQILGRNAAHMANNKLIHLLLSDG